MRSAGSDHEPGHFADARQRLSTKSKCLDPFEILRDPQLAGGVGGDRQRQVVGVDATAIVDNPDQRDASLFDRDIDPRRLRINRIFQELDRKSVV